jgi:hypothetical protein
MIDLVDLRLRRLLHVAVTAAPAARPSGPSADLNYTRGEVAVTIAVLYNGVLNKAKAGSAIPVKFTLSGNRGLAVLGNGSPASAAIGCDGWASQDLIEETVSASSSGLTYDATADQYIYVWKTNSAWATTCRKLTVTLVDGTHGRHSSAS